MVPFEFHRAQDDKGAIQTARGGARFLAGGTTLVDLMREHIEQPAALVDINRLPHRRIEMTARGLEIGALARMSDVAADRRIAASYPVIVESLLASASPQIRNMASVGGNLLQRTRCTYFRDPGVDCNKKQPGSGCPARAGVHRTHAIFGASEECVATHSSDLAVALVALDAVVRVRGDAGDRHIPLTELYRLPGKTPHLEHTLRADEMIVRIDIPAGAHTSRSLYLKVRDRESYEFALVSVATALHVDGGVIRAARVAAGGVGTTPWRLRRVEEALVGRESSARVWRDAAMRAGEGARPLTDNAFKVELLKRTVVRALEQVGGRV
ncbi:MAG TPA: xanthine dehydrogenase family protein subunit M [Blastocatellia bacterium]|nr:xanthine dehydrogenase family protein subunit M [Blastocatellia bacterium]